MSKTVMKSKKIMLGKDDVGMKYMRAADYFAPHRQDGINNIEPRVWSALGQTYPVKSF
ncbi:MAG: hypothetical protein PHP98_04955 [Kiritimatiellae bacterium]|nr:hypothetical protein [Kiritimatiellia bacterium]